MTKLIHIGEREIKANNLEGDEYLVYPNSCPNCGRETNELLDIY